MKTFEDLLPSEIRKAEWCANSKAGRKDCKVTAWSTNCSSNEANFVAVKCEICFGYEDPAEFGVTVHVYLPDRRRSFACITPY